MKTLKVMVKLEAMLAGYTQVGVIPKVMVFMGNFTSVPMDVATTANMQKMKGETTLTSSRVTQVVEVVV